MPSLLMLRNFGKRFDTPPLSQWCTKIFLRNASTTYAQNYSPRRTQSRRDKVFNLPRGELRNVSRLSTILIRFTPPPFSVFGKIEFFYRQVLMMKRIRDEKKWKSVHRTSAFVPWAFVVWRNIVKSWPNERIFNRQSLRMIYLISTHQDIILYFFSPFVKCLRSVNNP